MRPTKFLHTRTIQYVAEIVVALLAGEQEDTLGYIYYTRKITLPKYFSYREWEVNRSKMYRATAKLLALWRDWPVVVRGTSLRSKRVAHRAWMPSKRGPVEIAGPTFPIIEIITISGFLSLLNKDIVVMSSRV